MTIHYYRWTGRRTLSDCMRQTFVDVMSLLLYVNLFSRRVRYGSPTTTQELLDTLYKDLLLD